jgi:hypothetical protein
MPSARTSKQSNETLELPAQHDEMPRSPRTPSRMMRSHSPARFASRGSKRPAPPVEESEASDDEQAENEQRIVKPTPGAPVRSTKRANVAGAKAPSMAELGAPIEPHPLPKPEYSEKMSTQEEEDRQWIEAVSYDTQPVKREHSRPQANAATPARSTADQTIAVWKGPLLPPANPCTDLVPTNTSVSAHFGNALVVSVPNGENAQKHPSIHALTKCFETGQVLFSQVRPNDFCVKGIKLDATSNCKWVFNSTTSLPQWWHKLGKLYHFAILAPFGFIESLTTGQTGTVFYNNKPGSRYKVNAENAKLRITLSNAPFIPFYREQQGGDAVFSAFARQFTRFGSFTQRFVGGVKEEKKDAYLRRKQSEEKGLGAPNSFANIIGDHGQPTHVFNEEGEQVVNEEFVKRGVPDDSRMAMTFSFSLMSKYNGLTLEEVLERFPNITQVDNWKTIQNYMEEEIEVTVNKKIEKRRPRYQIMPVLKPQRVLMTEEERAKRKTQDTHRTALVEVLPHDMRKGGLFAPLFSPRMRQLGMKLIGYEDDKRTGLVTTNTLLGGVYIPPEDVAQMSGYKEPVEGYGLGDLDDFDMGF